MADSNLAKFLGARQKRLQYWRASFRPERIDGESAKEIALKLDTYALLLAKLAREASPAEHDETRSRLAKLEQELGALFELTRNVTADLAVRNGVETVVMKPK